MKCKDLVKSRKLYEWGKPTWGYGNEKSKIMFISEAPGMKGCGTTGIPFSGNHSGKFFQECLTLVDWKMEDVYTTNTVRCCPLKNRKPTIGEIENCKYWFWTEFREVQPQCIVTLGNVALKVFAPNRKLKEVAGKTFLWMNILILPLYHPAWGMRFAPKQYKKDFVKAISEMKAYLYKMNRNKT